jgi:hypothetical protein
LEEEIEFDDPEKNYILRAQLYISNLQSRKRKRYQAGLNHGQNLESAEWYVVDFKPRKSTSWTLADFWAHV